MVLGDAVLKLETFVWILNHFSKYITWSLFTLKASYLVKSPILTWSFMWWCQFIDWLKFGTANSGGFHLLVNPWSSTGAVRWESLGTRLPFSLVSFEVYLNRCRFRLSRYFHPSESTWETFASRLCSKYATPSKILQLLTEARLSRFQYRHVFCQQTEVSTRCQSQLV